MNNFQLFILVLPLIIMVAETPLGAQLLLLNLIQKFILNTMPIYVCLVEEINNILHVYFLMFAHSAVVFLVVLYGL